jgi:hypothetical protein
MIPIQTGQAGTNYGNNNSISNNNSQLDKADKENIEMVKNVLAMTEFLDNDQRKLSSSIFTELTLKKLQSAVNANPELKGLILESGEFKKAIDSLNNPTPFFDWLKTSPDETLNSLNVNDILDVNNTRGEKSILAFFPRSKCETKKLDKMDLVNKGDGEIDLSKLEVDFNKVYGKAYINLESSDEDSDGDDDEEVEFIFKELEKKRTDSNQYKLQENLASKEGFLSTKSQAIQSIATNNNNSFRTNSENTNRIPQVDSRAPAQGCKLEDCRLSDWLETLKQSSDPQKVIADNKEIENAIEVVSKTIPFFLRLRSTPKEILDLLTIKHILDVTKDKPIGNFRSTLLSEEMLKKRSLAETVLWYGICSDIEFWSTNIRDLEEIENELRNNDQANGTKEFDTFSKILDLKYKHCKSLPSFQRLTIPDTSYSKIIDVYKAKDQEILDMIPHLNELCMKFISPSAIKKIRSNKIVLPTFHEDLQDVASSRKRKLDDLINSNYNVRFGPSTIHEIPSVPKKLNINSEGVNRCELVGFYKEISLLNKAKDVGARLNILRSLKLSDLKDAIIQDYKLRQALLSNPYCYAFITFFNFALSDPFLKESLTLTPPKGRAFFELLASAQNDLISNLDLTFLCSIDTNERLMLWLAICSDEDFANIEISDISNFIVELKETDSEEKVKQLPLLLSSRANKLIGNLNDQKSKYPEKFSFDPIRISSMLTASHEDLLKNKSKLTNVAVYFLSKKCVSDLDLDQFKDCEVYDFLSLYKNSIRKTDNTISK